MADTLFSNEPQTVELLQSMRIVIRWLSSVPRERRLRLVRSLAECSDETRNVVSKMVSIVESPDATPLERDSALATIANALFSNSDDGGEFGWEVVASVGSAAAENAGQAVEFQEMDCQQAGFAQRLRELMTVRCLTQQELSSRIGCSQPAISQMLNRKARPQKKTILRLAEALQVQPQELWPDLEVADMLDAAADFQEDDHLMTDSEAKAMLAATNRNVPKIPVRPSPTRQTSTGNG